MVSKTEFFLLIIVGKKINFALQLPKKDFTFMNTKIENNIRKVY